MPPQQSSFLSHAPLLPTQPPNTEEYSACDNPLGLGGNSPIAIFSLLPIGSLPIYLASSFNARGSLSMTGTEPRSNCIIEKTGT